MQKVKVDHECPGRVSGRGKTDCLVDIDDLKGYRLCPKGLAGCRYETMDTTEFFIRCSRKDKNDISGDTGQTGKCDLGYEPRWCCKFDEMLCQFLTPSLWDEFRFR